MDPFKKVVLQGPSSCTVRAEAKDFDFPVFGDFDELHEQAQLSLKEAVDKHRIAVTIPPVQGKIEYHRAAFIHEGPEDTPSILMPIAPSAMSSAPVRSCSNKGIRSACSNA